MSEKVRIVEFKQKRPPKRRNQKTQELGNLEAPRAVVYHPNINHSSKLVALWLYDHMNLDDNVAIGPIRTIADEMKMSRGTVQRAINELCEYQIITSIEKGLNNHNVAYNKYRMWICESAHPTNL
jgi:hypothetical protein